jgi:muramidase (phage lysozyme)
MGLFDFGGSGDPVSGLYGDMLTPEQKQAIASRGLLGFLAGMQKSGALDYTVPFISGKVPGGLASGLAGGLGGMGTAQDEAVKNALNAKLIGLQGQNLQSQIGARTSLNDAIDKFLPLLAGGGGGAATTAAPQASGTAAQGNAETSPAVDQVTAGDEPQWRAFASAVAGPESGGQFNRRYTPTGGADFADLSKHPNIAEKGPYGPSTAAGAWQITNDTWNGLPEEQRQNFQPSTQYGAFKTIARRDYGAITGRDLDADLKAGNLGMIEKGLVGTWPTIGKALKAYPSLLANYTSAGTKVADNLAPLNSGMPDTSLDGAGASSGFRFGDTATPTSGDYATSIAPAPTPVASPAGLYGAPPQPSVGLFGSPPAGGTPPASIVGMNGTASPQNAAFVQAAMQRAGPSVPRGAAGTGGPSPGVPAAMLPQPNTAAVAPAPGAGAPQPGGPLVPGGGIDPRASLLAYLGAKSSVAGLGDTFKPFETALYNSPTYKAAVATAEESGKRGAGFPYDIATEREKSDLALRNERSKFVDVPGVGLVDLSRLNAQLGVGASTAQPGAGGLANNQPGVVVGRMTDAQRLNLETSLSTSKERLKEYHDEGTSAVQQVSDAASITDLLGRVRMGWGANTVQEGARILSTFGVPEDRLKQFVGTNPSAGDTLNKLFLKFSADAVRQMGAREPGSVISLFSKAYPNLETMPHAAELMTNALRMQAQWKQDRANAAEQWETGQRRGMGQFGENYAGFSGFEKQFADSNNPRDYWRAAAAMSNEREVAWRDASPTERQRVYDRIPAGATYFDGEGNQRRKPGA